MSEKLVFYREGKNPLRVGEKITPEEKLKEYQTRLSENNLKQAKILEKLNDLYQSELRDWARISYLQNQLNDIGVDNTNILALIKWVSKIIQKTTNI